MQKQASRRTYLSVYNFWPERVLARWQDDFQHSTIRFNLVPRNPPRARRSFCDICLPSDYTRHYRQMTIDTFNLLYSILEGDGC